MLRSAGKALRTARCGHGSAQRTAAPGSLLAATAAPAVSAAGVCTGNVTVRPGALLSHTPFRSLFFLFIFFIFYFYFLTGNRIGLALLADHPAIPPARFRSGRTRAAPHMSAQLRLSSARQELEAAYAGPCPGDGRIASAMPGPGRPCSAAPLNRASATRSAEVRIILRKDVRVSGGP